jgi:DUF4097 and DUF4098 domain-containing protein YvlB
MTIDKSIITVLVVGLLAGCTYNVTEVSSERTASISSAGVALVRFGTNHTTDNITVNGMTGDSIKAQIMLREMVAGDEQGSLDKVGFTVENNSGTADINLAYDGADWENIQVSDLTLLPDNRVGIDVSCQTGNVTVNQMRGYVTVHCETGNVFVETVRGCTVRDSTGNVEVKISADTAFTGIDLRTSTGNITVRVPTGLNADLDLGTNTGNVTVPDGSSTSRLNAGDSTRVIKCSSSTGNIKIKQE